MAFCLAAMMFSLAGIPPLAGFFAKYYVFLAAIKSGLVALAIIGVVTSVVGAFYYLRVIKVMYFDAPNAAPVAQRPGPLLRIVFAINALALLGLGLFWSPLMAWCQQAFA